MIERSTISETIQSMIDTYESDLESGAVVYEKEDKAGKKKGSKKGGK